MKFIIKHRRLLAGDQGMTLVEIMVTMVIIAIISGIVWNVSLFQMNSANKAGSVLEQEGAPTAALELLKRDLALAGYGILDEPLNQPHTKNASLFIRDGGSGPDKLYLNDGSYLDPVELGYDICNYAGYGLIKTGSGTTNITLKLKDPCPYDEQDSCSNTNPLDLDECPSQFDTSYGGDTNEFKGGIWQYVITNSVNPNSKVAKINTITGNTLSLDSAVTGNKVSPAVYYCVDYDGNDNNCHPAGGPTMVLRRSSRDSGGRQPVANNIVDMQIAYKRGTKWYCDGAGTCPMNPFYAGEVDLIRITLVARTGSISSSDPAYTDLTTVENGPSWGNDGYTYRVFSTSIKPRNNMEFQ
jgi:prepilin-type N-terminal cleavage/methylation domain-containing protein